MSPSNLKMYRAALKLQQEDEAYRCEVLNPRKCGNCMRWGLGLCDNSEKWSWDETNKEAGGVEYGCYLPTVVQIAIEAEAGIEHYEG